MPLLGSHESVDAVMLAALVLWGNDYALCREPSGLRKHLLIPIITFQMTKYVGTSDPEQTVMDLQSILRCALPCLEMLCGGGAPGPCRRAAAHGRV